MHVFDPLDWVHRYDQYEMVMYVRHGEEPTEDGIYIQVLESALQDGAEAWSILYDRKLADIPESDLTPGTDAWEDRVLRTYLNDHPDLVHDEKERVAALAESSETLRPSDE